MSRPAVLALDLDGVLVDGMEEYWRSSLAAARGLGAPWAGPPGEVPPAFRSIRPWVHRGWEMVVVTWALAYGAPAEAFLRDYPAALRQWQARSGQSSAALQYTLERHRSACLARDPRGWLAQHRLYPGVAERLRRCAAEGVEWVVVTTKGWEFAAALLAQDGLQPTAIYGWEEGPKVRVLRRLLEQRQPIWFVEDRLPTLEQVTADPQLAGVGCYLAAWGYLRHADRQQLRPPTHWLDHATFCAPFPAWPA
ncbi:HAD family hydrolase [Candidatus Synechococcus spongiarum]|nr:HAD family hydrolase [Candidatus Synechococcus spongiarum]